ncbi:prepro-carboxypeptidase Z [Hesseltinella vesiculosa]|uniref:Prepro-carboxypeptidase Z n=1 Tax=Hesseltinella vesiculosa TaxID=101127 RepID=A0A1X2GYD5_9FUNG|nr:prepro-carboxypeptidase Z [Hesseltinella vesiculosa]
MHLSKWVVSSLLAYTALASPVKDVLMNHRQTGNASFHQPKLCDPTVQQYSGYLDAGNNEHYFFWFFESRTNPDTAPLTVWLNGGPGCSSMIGLWQELGPCRVNADGTQDVYNDAGSWNKVSNMLFFDQPSGVGFSYGADNVHSTYQAAPLSYNLIQNFLKAFPKYQKNDFHFYGESYGGHYVPEFADYILQQNLNLAQGNVHVNLKSIGVGNGITDALIQNQYYQPMACNSTYGSVLSPTDCQTMLDNLPKCTSMTQKCYATGSDADCEAADNYCGSNVMGIYDNSGRSYYDVRTSQEIPSTYINFLNQSSTMAAIGATSQYTECSNPVGNKFYPTGDDSRNFAPNVTDLLNHGVQVLLYAGDADYICNWMGNYAWSNQFDFNGADAYRSQQLAPFNVNGKEVGQFKQGGNLTFVRIYEAGHEVPYYQPEASLQMFTNQVQGLAYS